MLRNKVKSQHSPSHKQQQLKAPEAATVREKHAYTWIHKEGCLP